MLGRRLGLGLLLLAALVPAERVSAGGPAGFFFFGTFSGSQAAVAGAAFGATALGFAATFEAERLRPLDETPLLIVDASPPDAQVYLDGRRLGAAGELVALALPVPPGPHTLQVVAPGHRPWTRAFYADGYFPVRMRAALTRTGE
jgi:hypothetical protein